MARGTMSISKGRDNASQANTVRVVLVVVRLPAVASDVLITFNRPVQIVDGSQSAGCRLATEDDERALIHSVLSTFEIVSWDIFPS
jgi:hypothetical protein